MIIVRHRVNTISDLSTIPSSQGVEIDIRSNGGELIIQHDPFKDGEYLNDWISLFHHQLLILNVKEDGLEDRIIDALSAIGRVSYFFLDQSFPSFFKLSKVRPEACSIRASEFESLELGIALQPGWVWFDSHIGNWDYLSKSFDMLRGTQIKTCLVSPELQRQDCDGELAYLKSKIYNESISFDAVCTKRPAFWQES